MLTKIEFPKFCLDMLEGESCTLESALASGKKILGRKGLKGVGDYFELETKDDLTEWSILKKKEGDRTDRVQLTVNQHTWEEVVEINRIYRLGQQTDEQQKALAAQLAAEEERSAKKAAEDAKTPLHQIGLTVRVFSILDHNQLRFVEDIFERTIDGKLHLRGFGDKANEELRDRLVVLGHADPNAEGIAPLRPKVADDREVLRVVITKDELFGKYSDDEDDFYGPEDDLDNE
jgi:hypothetical protein